MKKSIKDRISWSARVPVCCLASTTQFKLSTTRPSTSHKYAPFGSVETVGMATTVRFCTRTSRRRDPFASTSRSRAGATKETSATTGILICQTCLPRSMRLSRKEPTNCPSIWSRVRITSVAFVTKDWNVGLRTNTTFSSYRTTN